MSNLREQNILNIDSICNSSDDKAQKYEDKAFWLLHLDWFFWISITLMGASISLIESLNTDNSNSLRITLITLGAVIFIIPMLYRKISPYKRGDSYKKSAKKVRKLSRESANLKFSNLPPEIIRDKIEDIFSKLDDIELDLYSINSVNQGNMNKQFGQGFRANVKPLEEVKIDMKDINNENHQEKAS